MAASQVQDHGASMEARNETGVGVRPVRLIPGWGWRAGMIDHKTEQDISGEMRAAARLVIHRWGLIGLGIAIALIAYAVGW